MLVSFTSADVAKFQMIGFEVVETNGHDVNNLIEIINQLKRSKNGKPKAIIANTIKGKGVSYMENRLEWHYLPMNEELYTKALIS